MFSLDPPENNEKPLGFLTFSGVGIRKDYWERMR